MNAVTRGGEGGAALCALLVATAGCADAVDNDPGLDGPFRVTGGVYFREGVPAPAGGPRVLGAFLAQATFRVGEQDKSFSGVAELGSTGVALALDDGPGYWVVPTGMPFAETPDSPSFVAPLSFSASVGSGSHAITIWASNLDGVYGPPTQVGLTLVPRALPEGQLVVALSWDTPSDLDLHLITPNGTEVYASNVNSWQGSLGSADAEAWRAGGILDFDSNAGCVIDGRQNENVVWRDAPPSGSYLVRVDTPSLCGQPGARWRVDVLLDGQSIGAARGSGFETATRFAHGRGAGVLALGFDVP